MTQLEKLSVVLADGCWHLTEELLQEVGYRFSANRHTAAKKHGYRFEKRRGGRSPVRVPDVVRCKLCQLRA